MGDIKADIDKALMSIVEMREHNAYLSYEIRNCNADEPCLFTKGFISSPKYNIHYPQKAVSFNKLTNAFDVIKCDQENGMYLTERQGGPVDIDDQIFDVYLLDNS